LVVEANLPHLADDSLIAGCKPDCQRLRIANLGLFTDSGDDRIKMWPYEREGQGACCKITKFGSDFASALLETPPFEHKSLSLTGKVSAPFAEVFLGMLDTLSESFQWIDYRRQLLSCRQAFRFKLRDPGFERVKRRSVFVGGELLGLAANEDRQVGF
jgi:hypothetical protein